jgi:hypothetical protein
VWGGSCSERDKTEQNREKRTDSEEMRRDQRNTEHYDGQDVSYLKDDHSFDHSVPIS